MHKTLIDDGYTILKKAVPYELCDQINLDFISYVESNKDEADRFKLKSGNHSRLCNMHLVSQAAKEAISSQKIMSTLDEYFGNPAFVATSLYFQESSKQDIHRDVPFFNTKPRNIFVGVWIALEDVDAKAGPLIYYPKSHLLPITPVHVSETGGVGESFKKYCDDLKTACVDAGLNLEEGLVSKGDCIIWHAELAHGGSKIIEEGMTRKSMVFHCAPKDVVMYGAEEFFGERSYKKKTNGLILDYDTGREYIGHSSPIFAPNN